MKIEVINFIRYKHLTVVSRIIVMLQSPFVIFYNIFSLNMLIFTRKSFIIQVFDKFIYRIRGEINEYMARY